MNIFKNTPIDIVLHILSYDNKTIKNGKIVNIINKLDRIKYQNIIHLLENKPKINFIGEIMDRYREYSYHEYVRFPEGKYIGGFGIYQYYILTYNRCLHKYDFRKRSLIN